jgi:hypothetical protein
MWGENQQKFPKSFFGFWGFLGKTATAIKVEAKYRRFLHIFAPFQRVKWAENFSKRKLIVLKISQLTDYGSW